MQPGTTDWVVRAGAASADYLMRTPGVGFHHTLTVLYDASGAMLQALPRDAAIAISNTFQRTPNPFPYPTP